MNLFPKSNIPSTITLYKGIPFDNNYEEHIFKEFSFVSTNDIYDAKTMDDFLDIKLTPNDNYFKFDRYTLVGAYNFNYTNGLVCELIVEVPYQYTSCNYIKVVTGNEKRYYFITDTILQSSINDFCTIKLSLELDVIATWGGELMQSLTDKPLFVERKHCNRFKGSLISCQDLSTSEEAFYNCKPSVIESVYKTQPIIWGNVDSIAREKLNKILWCYITVAPSGNFFNGETKIGAVETPTYTLCLPLTDRFVVRLNQEGGTIHESTIKPIEWLQDNYADSDVYSIKFSPYPPFNYFPYAISFIGTTMYLDFNTSDVNIESSEGSTYIFTLNIRKDNKLISVLQFRTAYPFLVQQIINPTINYETITINQFEFNDLPTIYDLKDEKYEIKLLFSPCKKYTLFYRASEGYEIHPELQATEHSLRPNINITTYTTPAMSDLTQSTYVSYEGSESVSNSFTELNKGLNSRYNYVYPSGSDALKNFYATQSASFTAGTTAGVLAGILGVVGGIVTAQPLAIGAGALSIGTSVGKAVGKHIDLARTPNQVNETSSSVFHDSAIIQYNEDFNYYPLIVVESLTKGEKKIVLDYLYNFGYNVQRECYFNTSNSNPTDEILTRKLFNYIKINDNIRKHINNDIPSVIVEKMNEILNKGVKLWTLFGVGFYWNNYDEYLFKDKYENAEII